MFLIGANMPPKPKFTKEEIAMTALNIIKEEGINALTARNLADYLKSSARPIFTIFKNMEEVKQAARELALKEFEKYLGNYEDYSLAFKRIGMRMISYAIDYPEQYKLLYMEEYSWNQSFKQYLNELGTFKDICIHLLQKEHTLSQNEANTLFEQLWIYAYGIGSLCAMKVCEFSEEEIADRLGLVFAGILTMIKTKKTYLKEAAREEKNE